MVSEISAQSDKQAEEIANMNHSIEQISQFVQVNAATSEENAASSYKLLHQVTELSDIVSTYKL